jgi:tetratricopeptide (TPR) repeat protein
MGRVTFILLTALATLVASVSNARLDRLAEERIASEELLYLPNGKHLKLASMGQAPLIADALYLWAIQYYSNYQRADRFKYVEHVFGDVIAELDPHAIDTYWLGAMILSVEARDLEGALRLLEKGFSYNPDNWLLPYMAGWECHQYGQYGRATTYFQKAAMVPGAPMTVRRVRAGMTHKAGNLRESLRLWQEVADDPEADDHSIRVADARIRDLRVKADIRDLEYQIQRFRDDNGALPASLEELRGKGYIRHVPLDPDGQEYAYDRETGAVSSGSRLLSES